jgi:hypothetical protein
LLDLTAKFVCTRPDGKERIMKKNQEQLFLRGNDPADTRRMFSYPSSVGGLKGVGGKVGHALSFPEIIALSLRNTRACIAGDYLGRSISS